MTFITEADIVQHTHVTDRALDVCRWSEQVMTDINSACLFATGYAVNAVVSDTCSSAVQLCTSPTGEPDYRADVSIATTLAAEAIY